MKLSRGHTAIDWHGPKDGPLVIMVHGLTTASYVWEGVIPHLTSAGMRVLTYDHYGRGGSAAPHGRQDYAFFTSHLAEVIEASCTETPVHLVGYSMGGGIVAEFAHKYPQLCNRVVMIAPIGFDVNLGWAARCANIPLVGDIFMRMFGPAMFRKGAESEAQLDGTSAEFVKLQSDGTRVKGFARSVLSSMRYCIGEPLIDTHHSLANSGVPLCAIWGAEDTVIPLSSAKQLTDINPSVETYVVEDGRHGVTYTHSAQVGQIIRNFLV